MPSGIFTEAHRRKVAEANTHHGHYVNGIKSPTYQSWRSMLQRCLNPNQVGFYKWGGRGIRVCIRWITFEFFLEDMGIRPIGQTLERIDNDGHYEPGNVKWATPSEQQRNRCGWGKRIVNV
jgi:hypothetical protein